MLLSFISVNLFIYLSLQAGLAWRICPPPRAPRIPIPLLQESARWGPILSSPLPGTKGRGRLYVLSSWADPALLRFAFVTELLAFRLRGEQLPLLALPRKREAGPPSVLSTCPSRFGGHGPCAGLAGRRQDFFASASMRTAAGDCIPLYSACGGAAPIKAWADPAWWRYASVTE